MKWMRSPQGGFDPSIQGAGQDDQRLAAVNDVVTASSVGLGRDRSKDTGLTTRQRFILVPSVE